MQTLTKFIPSHYQKAIFDFVTEGRGDAVINAVAGSGKTSTLVESSKLLQSDRALFLAFNKHIATELETRLGGNMTAKTIHSIGVGCLRSYLPRVTVDEGKIGDISKPYAIEISNHLERAYQLQLKLFYQSADADKAPEEPPTYGVIIGLFKKIVHYIRVTLTDVKNKVAVEEICDRFGCIDIQEAVSFDALYTCLPTILKESERAAERGIIDYDDMLWLPHAWGLQPSKYEWVFVDECQDLSAAQLDLVLKLRAPGGRMLFVGDKRQAIYGFAGADSESFDRIIELTQATVLPLSICYRCPSSHIKLAQSIVADIEAKNDAVEGIIEDIKLSAVHDEIQEGDLVISRCTAPVVKLCIELIAKRIPARVRGRDIGKALTTIVRDVAKHPEFNFAKFGKYLKEYADIKLEKLKQKRNSEAQIASFSDRIQGIEVCYEAFNVRSVGELCSEIEALFSDTRSSVILSTVHRAKGLENRRVFILEPDKLPLRYPNQQAWELQQEFNLKYVALTRAKQALYFIK